MKTILKTVAALSVAALTFGLGPAMAEGGESTVNQQRAKLKAEWSKARAGKADQSGFTLFGLLSEDAPEVSETSSTAPKTTN